MSSYALLVVLMVLTTASALAYKLASQKLSHHSAPAYTAIWVLIGLALVFIPYKSLFFQGLDDAINYPFLVIILVVKGFFIWFLFYKRLVLVEKSLSASSFFMPTALGFIAVINSFLGENLTALEWGAAVGLCLLGVAFFLRGHIQELGKSGRFIFIQLVFVIIILATLDQVILQKTNWFFLLLSTNLVMLFITLCKKIPLQEWRLILLSKESILAGSLFSASELLKFYLMVTILPMSVVISGQVAIIPIVLVLSSLIWGERSWKEQLIWGIISTLLLLLLFL